LNALHAERQQAYVDQIKELNEDHVAHLNDVTRQWKQDSSDRDQRHTAEIARINQENQANVARLNKVIADKDAQIVQMAKDHSAQLQQASANYATWVKKTNQTNFAKVFKLQSELSLFAKVKKEEILLL
jgi:hypothetical protein